MTTNEPAIMLAALGLSQALIRGLHRMKILTTEQACKIYDDAIAEQYASGGPKNKAAALLLAAMKDAEQG